MPRMKALFMAFDPHRYPKMACTPCHETAEWRMPNADLLLDPACGGEALDVGAPSGAVHDHPSPREKMSRLDEFMLNEVTPEMAKLLGMPAYDPAERKGFGCFGCHTPER
jgi:hypothetical protein